MHEPERTPVVSPENESRREINSQIHRAMQETGQIQGEGHGVRVLFALQDLTGTDRQLAPNITL
jgi:hypothetical protein